MHQVTQADKHKVALADITEAKGEKGLHLRPSISSAAFAILPIPGLPPHSFRFDLAPGIRSPR